MEHVEAASCQNHSMAAQMPLAISYVPMQKFVNVANAADGFKMGTIFEDLYLNFYCTECRTGGCGQNRYMRRTDGSNMGYMSSNTGRNARNYNMNYGSCNNNRNMGCNHHSVNTGCDNPCNNVNAGCGCRNYNNANTGSSNYNSNTGCGNQNYNNIHTGCGNRNYNNANTGCGCRNQKSSGCRMNNCNGQS